MQREDLNGVRFAIQGLGQTGIDLCGRLAEAGGKVVATDVNDRAIGEAKQRFGIEVVEPDDIYAVNADVFVPDYVVNAGGVINGSDDIFKTYQNSEAERRIRGLGDVLIMIFDRSKQQSRPTLEIADDMARARMTGS